jgi:hypothetical protein
VKRGRQEGVGCGGGGGGGGEDGVFWLFKQRM